MAEIARHVPAVLGMLTGSRSATWIGEGWLRRTSDKLSGRLILIMLAALNLVLVAEGSFVTVSIRLVATVLVAAAGEVVIGLVSPVLGVAGRELIIPVSSLLFGVDVNLSGSIMMLAGMPNVAGSRLTAAQRSRPV